MSPLKRLLRKGLLLLLPALLLLSSPPALARQPEGEVIYEIFVRAFADSDGDGIGDFKGLQGKLDYLAGLGVGAVWLMPIHPSPSYHGYDVTDYRGVNPDYGSLDDFTSFLAQAHARGIRVLLDLPLNHTSSSHPWFLESKKEDSPYRQYYHWKKEGEEGLLEGLTVWGDKPWKRAGDSWYYAIFWGGMPDLNYDNPAVRREALDIARYWLGLGVDGFRLDATSHIFGEGETARLQDIAASSAFWREFSSEIKRDFPDALLLGEAWEPLDKRAELARGLDSLVNFDVGDRLLPLIKTGGSGAAFVQAMYDIQAAYQKTNPGYVDAPFLSNHDQTRVAAVLQLKPEKMKLAARILLTLPGRPIVYYGEEIGMSGAKPDEELRTPFLWGEGDGAQTAWRASRYNNRTVPLLAQEKDPDSLYRVYRDMIAFRNSHPALARGRLEPFAGDNPIPLAFYMISEEETLLVLHNPSSNEQVLSIPDGAAALYAAQGSAAGEGKAVLPGLSTLILQTMGENHP